MSILLTTVKADKLANKFFTQTFNIFFLFFINEDDKPFFEGKLADGNFIWNDVHAYASDQQSAKGRWTAATNLRQNRAGRLLAIRFYRRPFPHSLNCRTELPPELACASCCPTDLAIKQRAHSRNKDNVILSEGKIYWHVFPQMVLRQFMNSSCVGKNVFFPKWKVTFSKKYCHEQKINVKQLGF